MPNQPDRHLRAQLPIPDIAKPGLTTYDAKDPDTKYPPIEPLRPPAGAPNVLLVLLDDVGFGAASAFGGPCNTPTFEKLATDGLRYNRFHTCALCAPTRQALMTGRNHHSVGMGNITETATAAPGQNSLRANTKAPVAMLRKLQRLWLIEATKYNAIPLDDRQAERLIPEIAGRPTLIRGNTQMLFPGMGRLSELSVLNLKNKSFSATAEIEVGSKPANGVIVAQGGRFGGWSVYFKEGCLCFVYNVLGIRYFPTKSTQPTSAGKHQVRMEFAYDGGGMGKGGNVTLYTDGQKVAVGRVDATQAMIFSADETLDIGCEYGTPVSPDYTTAESKFTGKVHWVQLDAGVDDHDHFIDPEERWRVAMARQ